MNPDTHQSLARSALRFFSGTMLSRVSGLGRDMAMAFCFGTSPALAAFFLAYRFVYLIRRLFGEGLLHQGFIPHFETKKKEDPRKGALFFRDLFFSLSLILGTLIVAAEIALSFSHSEIARLAMWMLPGIFFICLFGLSTGLLQSERSFFLPSVSPVASNLVWILGVVALRHLPISDAVIGLSIVLSFAFFAQWAITVPRIWNFLRRSLSVKELLSISPFSSELKALARPLMLGMIGVASVQVNSAIDGIFARWADLEGPAYLWYAIRIQQLPLALFGLAISSALLPSLSRAIEEEALDRFESLLRFAKRRIFLLIFPCTVGIFVLGAASVNLLFGRGDFGIGSVYQTTLCLWCYGIGLLPSAFVQVVAQGFYAKKDYWTPTKGFISAALLNTALNALLVFVCDLGAASIALATSFSTIVNSIYLSHKLGLKIDFRPMAKVGACALIAGLVVLGVGYALGDPTLQFWSGDVTFPETIMLQLIHFGLQTTVYFLIFFGLCHVAKVDELMEILSRLKRL
ncbi:MAG: murein biosynthesis integral membrane protein MurJ [Verrucomicrobia bacterium]|nr:murein biosynthesis integral membrane protein MurJ [Verrucomicrobiota bacterium]